MERNQKEIEQIIQAESIYIYGAGDVAKEVAWCLMHAPYEKQIEAFVVSEDSGDNPKEIYGRPVVALNEVNAGKDALILVSVLEKYRDEICTVLNKLGYENYRCPTFESDLWADIRRSGFAVTVKGTEYQKIKYLKDYEYVSDTTFEISENNFSVFVAKNHKDRPLRAVIPSKSWETDIQAGAALTEERIAELTDHTGKNISEKNAQYCELTALYWIWKNTDSAYAGLSHYRRRFDLKPEDIRTIIESDIDIVVTVPILNVPNVLHMYEKNHLFEDWERMRNAVKKLYPEYENALAEVENGKWYFAYNMFIMKRECLNDYCEWLFRILEACEDSDMKRDAYQNRYIGFLAERLMSVYVVKNLDKYKIVYADKSFFE